MVIRLTELINKKHDKEIDKINNTSHVKKENYHGCNNYYCINSYSRNKIKDIILQNTK